MFEHSFVFYNTSYAWFTFMDCFYLKEEMGIIKYSDHYLLGTSHDYVKAKICSNSCLQGDAVANRKNIPSLYLSVTLWKIEFSYYFFPSG